MGITSVAQETTRAVRKFKHSIAERNRPTRHGNTFIFLMVVDGRFHREFKIMLEGRDHGDNLYKYGEEESVVVVDEE